MKPFLTWIAIAAALTTVAYAAVWPDGGLMFQSPLTPLALGMIGLGLCMQARSRRADLVGQPVEVDP